MANAKEIRERMNSVRDTAKITNAMYLISSTKMQKAKRSLEAARPYFETIHSKIENIFKDADDVENSRYFVKEGSDIKLTGNIACLVVTADKGLCGSYNINVIRETERLLKKYPEATLYVIGEYGRRYFDRHGIAYDKSFIYRSQAPTLEEAREISDILLEQFDSGRSNRVYVLYTDMQTVMNSVSKYTRILPFEVADFKKNAAGGKTIKYEYFPSASAVLETALRSLTAGFVYGGLVASFCSEQNARMMAMESANDNAEKILDELKLEYNRIRQAAITLEITEISSGELAQKRKRMKEQAKEWNDQ